MHINCEIKVKKLSDGRIRLENFPNGEFFRKDQDGDIYRKLFHHGDSVVTINMRTLETVYQEFHFAALPVHVRQVNIEIEVLESE